TALGAALSPVTRSTNEQLRARRLQSDKNSHHSEDVEEIDDTVNGVRDHSQERGGGRGGGGGQTRQGEEYGEKVEIVNLSEPVKPGKSKNPPPPLLDISA